MKITFLGTGTSQGVPVIACQCPVCRSVDQRDRRLRSSIFLETGGIKIVVDCGPDFRQQMLREQITSVDALLVTHGHKDHLGGLDDVRAFNYINQSPADVYATTEVQKIIRREFFYAFRKDPYPGVPEINLHTFGNKPINIRGIIITPIKAVHYNKRHVFGFRIGDFSYLTDAKFIPDREKKKIMGSKILVINALRKQVHYSHFNLEEAVAIINEISPQNGYLTHISHQMGKYEDISKELPLNVNLAYDGLSINL
jgi:phosphoribosyl 1,2-cyclic phosphate phosphodiesterase